MARNEPTLADLPPSLQGLVLIILAVVIIWVFFGHSISTFWSNYWYIIVIILLIVLIVGVYIFIKFVMPERMRRNKEIEEEANRRMAQQDKEKELEKSILEKKLIKDRKNQLTDLTEEEKRHLINKWVELEYQRQHSINQDKKESNYKYPPLTQKEQHILINAVGNRCENPACKKTHPLSVHHIISRAEGGTNRLGNLVVLCRNCHEESDNNAFSRGVVKSWINSKPRRFRHQIEWKWSNQ